MQTTHKINVAAYLTIDVTIHISIFLICMEHDMSALAVAHEIA